MCLLADCVLANKLSWTNSCFLVCHILASCIAAHTPLPPPVVHNGHSHVGVVGVVGPKLVLPVRHGAQGQAVQRDIAEVLCVCMGWGRGGQGDGWEGVTGGKGVSELPRGKEECAGL